MGMYSYKAKTAAGEIATGHFDAIDKSMVVTLLKNKGLYPISISESSFPTNDTYNYLLRSKKVNSKELSIFCRQFYILLKSGATVSKSIEILATQIKNEKLSYIIKKVDQKLKKSMTLSESVKIYKNYFSTIFVRMIEIGEITKNLEFVLNRLSIYFEKEDKLAKKIKISMLYPIAITCISMVAIFFGMRLLVPHFVESLTGLNVNDLETTKIILNSWLINNILILIFIGIIFMGIRKLTTTNKGKIIWDKLLLMMPFVSKLNKKLLVARLTYLLGILLQSGLPLIQSLSFAGDLIDNKIVSAKMPKIIDKIKKGSSLAESLEITRIFPKMAIQMIGVGEKSDEPTNTIEETANYFYDELNDNINKLAALIQPVLFIGMIIFVCFITITMILPIFKINR